MLLKLMTQNDDKVDDRCKGLHGFIWDSEDPTRPTLPIYTVKSGHKHRQCRCYYVPVKSKVI